MQWDVRGAWKVDGGEAQMNVEAPTQRAAEYVAARRGMVVSSCWPIQAEQPQPQPKHEDGAKLVGAVICSIISILSLMLAGVCIFGINRGDLATDEQMVASGIARSSAVVCAVVGIVFGVGASVLKRQS